MTDRDLHTLFRELAEELTKDAQPATGVERAWTDGAARARRGRLAVVGSAAAVALVVTGAVVAGELRGDPPSGPVAPGPSPSPSTLPLQGGTTPDGTFGGARVFWGPTVAQEADLPALTEARPALPTEIDLAGAAGRGRIDRALAAFGVGDRAGTGLQVVRLLAADGTWRDLQVGDLEPVADASGNVSVPLVVTSLSPSGRRLAFVQPDRVVLYDVASEAWSDFPWPGVESVAWQDDRHLLIPGTPGVRSDVVALDGRAVSDLTPGSGMPGQQPYGPRVSGWVESVGGYYEDAQAYYSVPGVPVPTGTITNPEVARVSVGDDRPLLVVWPDSPGDRAKACCRPATWLPSGEIVFQVGDRLLSWDPGTHDFRRVSTIVGTPPRSFAVASWADLSH